MVTASKSIVLERQKHAVCSYFRDIPIFARSKHPLRKVSRDTPTLQT